MNDEMLARIAAALERLSPPTPEPADPLAHPAYVWSGATLRAARDFAPVPIDLLAGIDAQKTVLVENLRRLAAGLPAHDALLWGARGTGKSALVKAAVVRVQADGGGIALIEAESDALDSLPALFALLAGAERAFALFIDDLGFEGGGAGESGSPRRLRSLLEGGAEARPGNVRLLVTANRRHIVPRDIAEQESAIAARDVMDDKLALADRFGLSLGFHVVDQPTYVAIVAGYAKAHGLLFDPQDAIAWATARGSRSGRVAWQYVVELAGRRGKRL
ncbi:ATP-binding protein [Sphingomonas bacterium]|uniref:ATP-binding protein n=1 Tax=Sphingomonas bacterium TaxID=1895847 RepID=UPI0015759878|nr:ATP-binding protein [Sphingomonas bacterium]